MGTKCVLAGASCARVLSCTMHSAVECRVLQCMTCTNLIGALLATAEQVTYRQDTRPFLCEGAGPPD